VHEQGLAPMDMRVRFYEKGKKKHRNSFHCTVSSSVTNQLTATAFILIK
jgi:hypothetical protein